MEAPKPCGTCGAENDPIAVFCERCGTAFPPGARGASIPPSSPAPSLVPTSLPYPAPYPTLPIEGPRHRAVQRTKTGIALLAISAFLAWIPCVNAIGSLLGIAGAVLGVLGRHPFGRRHSTFVGGAVALYTVAFAAAVLFALWLLVLGGAGAGLLWALMWMVIVTTPVFGIAWAAFAYELSDRIGRAILLIRFVLTLIVPSVAIFGFLADDIASAARFPEQIATLELLLDLSGTPYYILFGIAYVMAWERIASGRIPSPLPPPNVPPGVPAPPTPVARTLPRSPGPAKAPASAGPRPPFE